jgi:hypothetical protein
MESWSLWCHNWTCCAFGTAQHLYSLSKHVSPPQFEHGSQPLSWRVGWQKSEPSLGMVLLLIKQCSSLSKYVHSRIEHHLNILADSPRSQHVKSVLLCHAALGQSVFVKTHSLPCRSRQWNFFRLAWFFPCGSADSCAEINLPVTIARWAYVSIARATVLNCFTCESKESSIAKWSEFAVSMFKLCQFRAPSSPMVRDSVCLQWF